MVLVRATESEGLTPWENLTWEALVYQDIHHGRNRTTLLMSFSWKSFVGARGSLLLSVLAELNKVQPHFLDLIFPIQFQLTGLDWQEETAYFKQPINYRVLLWGVGYVPRAHYYGNAKGWRKPGTWAAAQKVSLGKRSGSCNNYRKPNKKERILGAKYILPIQSISCFFFESIFSIQTIKKNTFLLSFAHFTQSPTWNSQSITKCDLVPSFL